MFLTDYSFCAVFDESKKVERTHISSCELLNNFSYKSNSDKQAVLASFYHLSEVAPFTAEEHTAMASSSDLNPIDSSKMLCE